MLTKKNYIKRGDNVDQKKLYKEGRQCRPKKNTSMSFLTSNFFIRIILTKISYHSLSKKIISGKLHHILI
jgi:hypothetical protein